MILQEATIYYRGYDPYKLNKSSNKRICCSCDQCGRVRWVSKQSYRDLCKTCSNKSRIGKKFTGETRQKMKDNHVGMEGKYHSEETKKKIGEWGKGKKHSEKSKKLMSDKQKGKKFNNKHKIKISCAKQDIEIEDFHGFVGRHNDRDYVFSKELCIQLNNKIDGFNAHHILPSVIIYIPRDLHRLIPHNMKTGKNMKEINKLAFNYLMGDY